LSLMAAQTQAVLTDPMIREMNTAHARLDQDERVACLNTGTGLKDAI
jgi:enoyl-CoA hydratase/carnithine racemase